MTDATPEQVRDGAGVTGATAQPSAVLAASPYLGYPDGDAAAEWLQQVLGFGPLQVHRNDDGSWFEGDLQVGTTRVHISGGSPMAEGTGVGALIIVDVTDVDASYRRILDSGIDIDPPVDQPYGPRTCHVTDPWGYRWYLWQGAAHYT